MEKIFIKNLRIKGHLGASHWQLDEGQMLIFNIVGYIKFVATDSIEDTVSYFTISEHIQQFLETERKCKTLERLADIISLDCLELGLEKVSVQIEKSHALLHADTVGIKTTREKKDIQYLRMCSGAMLEIPCPFPDSEDCIFIKDLALSCIVGVNTFEKIEKQRIFLNIQVYFNPVPTYSTERIPDRNDYRTIARKVSQFVEASRYKTIEMMAIDVADVVLYQCNVEKTTIRIEKPSALMFADTAGVEITRTNKKFSNNAYKFSDRPKVAYLAIGTNLGNRVSNIEHALSIMSNNGLEILNSSFLYETAPMYVLDQPNFLNACVTVKTKLEPLQLLKLLKQIEADLGRNFNVERNGPRIIDLDILFYENVEMNTETLTIPHPRIQERHFVLRPLNEYFSFNVSIAHDYHHPTLFRTVGQLLKILEHSETISDKIHRVYPIRNNVWNFAERTFIMGILNVTPDSFSDGGKNYDVDSAVNNAMKMIDEKVDMIDIGGQSTRPNAPEISAEEEIRRVVPVIEAIRKRNTQVPISIDTFRASVAKAAIDAGADLINDVSGGKRDPEMLKVMAQSHKPACLMHMRGDSFTMMQKTEYKGDLINIMRKEITDLVKNAIDAGVFRWNIVIDPGIGFAKDFDQNYVILKRLKELTAGELQHLPLLVGVSRKGFIGKTTGHSNPNERIFGTAAANTIAIMNGANIIRVHDIKEMRDVLLIADSTNKNL